MLARDRTFLLVPAGGAGEGVGHLRRCLGLASRLGHGVTFLADSLDSAARGLLEREVSVMRARPSVIGRIPRGARWDVIVVDARRTSADRARRLMEHGLVAGVDEGGDAAGIVPFLIDALPGLPGRRDANLASPAFLSLPKRGRRQVRVPPRSILVTFGGEDREDLSGLLLEAIQRSRVSPPKGLTVVEGPLFGRRSWPAGVRIERGDSSALSRLILAHDLVITHFGMTAMEALASGVPVVLLNPSALHARLGRAAGIPSIGIRRPSMRTLEGLLTSPRLLQDGIESFNAALGADRSGLLARTIRELAVHGSSSCPVCGRAANPVVARFPDRTYRRCSGCGILALQSFAARRKSYARRYFSSEYKAQYGRTYLEDFEFIKASSRPRAAVLMDLLADEPDGAVVDVGCAYGPFLDVLKERGVASYGLDVSPHAAAHVRENLGIPALCAPFETVLRQALPRRICAITMWYVIEHFPDTDSALRKAALLLPPGGVFAFSTPNGRGISARTSLSDFLRASPSDHFTVLSPRGLRRILATYGMDLRRIRVTGHHPERFPGVVGRAASRWRPVAALVRASSRLLRLGDTFEAYAVRSEK